ncbi:MAG: acyltransferase [Bacteriovoracales bacterium]
MKIFNLLKGLFSITFASLNLIFWGSLILFFAFLKIIIPFDGPRNFFSKILIGLGNCWIKGNNFNMALTQNIIWKVEGLESLKLDEWYMVISNHQSWTDILVLQKIFLGRIPFLKFFLKQELIWVPILGPCWWALDFPFMKRYSKEFLEKNPHLRGKDLETTKIACEKFKKMPISIMNFVEGTRFTKQKQVKKKSPYKNLLSPKAGGVGFLISAMGDYIHKLINVTIYYPGSRKSLWDLFFGKISEIRVKVEIQDIPMELKGDIEKDPKVRENVQRFLNETWEKKDGQIQELAFRT